MNYYIKKYGEELGRIKYDNRIKSWQNNLHQNFEKYGDGRSYQSRFAKDIITNICNKLNIEIPKKEKYITGKISGRHY